MGVEMTICANQLANSSDEDDDHSELNEMAKQIYQNSNDEEGDRITDDDDFDHFNTNKKPSIHPGDGVESNQHLKIIITSQQSSSKTTNTNRGRRNRRNEHKHSRQRSRSLTFLTTNYSKPKKKKPVKSRRKSKLSKTKRRSSSSSKRKMRRRRSSPLHTHQHHETEKQKHDLLQAQYDLLRKQNQQFIAKHGSFFAEAYDTNSCSSSLSPSSSAHKPSLHRQTSITSLQSTHSNASSSSSGSNASCSSFTSNETMSPLSTLSGFHANIILTYSDSSFPFPTPPTLPHSLSNDDAFGHSMDVLNLSEIADEPESCECVANCQCIKRVMMALKWYESHCNDDDEEILLERIKQQFVVKGYDGYLMRDYQHILDYHLTQQQEQQEIDMGMEYALIKNELIKHVGFCDIMKCKAYKRYRESLRNESEDRLFLLSFMDLVHCFLMHLEHLQ